MNIFDYIKSIWEPHNKSMKDTLAEDALSVSNDLIALSQQRRIDKGENAEGDKFSDYSNVYAKYRKERGRSIEHKQYFFTGELNRSQYNEITNSTNSSVTVSINVRGADNEGKVLGAYRNEIKNGSTEKGANILEFSDSELKLANDAWIQRRLDRTNKNLK